MLLKKKSFFQLCLPNKEDMFAHDSTQLSQRHCRQKEIIVPSEVINREADLYQQPQYTTDQTSETTLTLMKSEME